jgi:hypothetical protein
LELKGVCARGLVEMKCRLTDTALQSLVLNW